MPRGKGIYVDEPRDQARTAPPDTGSSGKSSQDEKHDVAPDEQSLEHAQEPPD